MPSLKGFSRHWGTIDFHWLFSRLKNHEVTTQLVRYRLREATMLDHSPHSEALLGRLTSKDNINKAENVCV